MKKSTRKIGKEIVALYLKIAKKLIIVLYLGCTLLSGLGCADTQLIKTGEYWDVNSGMKNTLKF